MNGTIGVESQVGVGSTFWFTMPFEITDKLNQEKSSRKQRMLSGTIPPAKARVLVAEDHPMNQMLMTKLLNRFGILSFEMVENGEIALQRYKESSWDVILMDCHMPEKNGYDTTIDIRKIENATRTHVPIIAMTANAMIGDKEKCMRVGMDEYISKPINIDELKEVLGQWIAFPDLAKNEKEETPADETASVDLSILKTFSEGDTELEKKFIGIFVVQSDKNIKTLAENRANADTKPWHDAAHMFKGGSSSIGANQLAALCNQAEHFEGTAEEKVALFEKIDSEYARVQAHLKKIGYLA
jgi:CheY-like chemotaxis protein/HPt (histidine-containing phosphotransfer) domain-containing protein